MIYEHSAGSIIYRWYHQKLQFLIVQSVLHHTWGFPKGHLQPGEDERQAARREVAEEVGLHPQFDFNFRRETTYKTEMGTLKLVGFFLSKFNSQEVIKNQKAEIAASRWINLTEAQNYLPEKRKLPQMLKEVTVYLKHKSQNQLGGLHE